MANFFTRFLLFLSSYSPLLIIFGIQNIATSCKLAGAFIITAVLSVIVLIVYLKVLKNLGTHLLHIENVLSRDGDAMSYMVSYLIPFLDIKFDNLINIISLCILFLVIGIIYINSNLIHTNPILNLFGYHIFEVTSDKGKTSLIISKNEYIRPDTSLTVVSLGDYACFEVGDKK